MPTRLRYPVASWIVLMVACGYTLLRIDDLLIRETVGMVALAWMIILVPWTVGAAFRAGRVRGRQNALDHTEHTLDTILANLSENDAHQDRRAPYPVQLDR